MKCQEICRLINYLLDPQSVCINFIHHPTICIMPMQQYIVATMTSYGARQGAPIRQAGVPLSYSNSQSSNSVISKTENQRHTQN